MVEQEIIRAMVEADVQPLFSILGITLAGLAPVIKDALTAGVQYGGIRSQASQAKYDRDLDHEEWLKMFEQASAWREEDVLRQEEARLEAIRQWEAEHAQSEAEWMTDIERSIPNVEASRAILANTMQTDVQPYTPYKYFPV